MIDGAPPNVLYMLASLYGLLLLASIIHAVLQSRAKEPNPELGQRIRSWWVIVTVFTLALLMTRAVSLSFFACISFLAFKEYLSIIPTRRADRRVLFWAYLAIPIQYYWIYIDWYNMFLIFVPVYMLLFLPLRMVIMGETASFLRAVGTIHWGLMMMVFGISHMAYVLVLPAAGNPVGGGAGLLLYLVFLTQINDVAQYLWGKTLGRRRIVPSVSPNKTWEGFLGGVATTICLATLLAPWLTPLSLPLALGAGALISVCGFVGDVTISAVKRDLGIKDTGAILPGHGGILDRLDSLTYTAPLFFHYMKFFYF